MTSGAENERTAATAGLADALVFAAVFALYAAAASPALGWLDSPELVAASVGLGVPHSPGHPLPVFLGAAATLVPVGDLALRVNLAAAAAGAAACALLAAAGRQLISRTAPEVPRAARTWMAAAVALAVGGSWAWWAQSVRAEVYALAAALLIAALGAVLAWDGDRRPGWLVAAGLAGGLALATHHLIAVLLLVPAGVFVLARRERPAAALAGATALAGVVGLAAFLYLPVRSAAGPELDWGAPSAAARFLWTVSGAMFAGTATAEQVSPIGEDAAQSLWAVGEAAGAPVAILALFGAIALRRRVAALLIAVAAAGIAGRALFGFDPDTPDHHGYLLPSVAAVALLGLAGAAALARRPPIAAAIAIAGLGLAIARAALGWPDAALAGAHASDDLARRELESLPPRALLVTSYFETSYRALALRAVEETRPDVDVLHRGMLTLPGAREAAETRHPDLAALLRAPLAAGRPTPVAELAAVAAARPIAFELDPDLDPPASARLVSSGRFARFATAAGERERAAAESADARARLALSALMSHTGGGDREGARRALLWLDLSRLVHYCTLGRRAAAQEALLGAWDLFPGDVILEEHAARCGLQTPRRSQP